MAVTGNTALASFSAGIHSFVVGDVGVNVVPTGFMDGAPQFCEISEISCDLSAINGGRPRLSPFALSLPSNPEEVRPGRLRPQFQQLVGIFAQASEKVGRIPGEKKRDERIEILATKEAIRGNDLGRNNRGLKAAEAFMLSGAYYMYYMNMQGGAYRELMARMFKRGALNYLDAQQNPLSALAWELAAFADPSQVRTYGSQAARLWLEVYKDLSDPEDRYLAIGQGLHFAWHASSWKSAKMLLEALADLDFGAERLDSSASDQLRAAWLGSRTPDKDLGYVAERLDDAITIWELGGIGQEYIADARKLAERALTI